MKTKKLISDDGKCKVYKTTIKPILERDRKGKKCNTCNINVDDINRTGEKIEIFKKSWLNIFFINTTKEYKWVWWCKKCYTQKFIRDIGGNPLASAKYLKMYGKKPSEILTP